jgi:DNA-binding beta-propeller fold protein YncE
LSPPEAVTLIGRYGRGSGINQINQVTNLIAPASTPSLLYMADSNNHRILLWNSDSNYTSVVAGTSGIFGSNSTLLYNPFGITLDEKTNSLYIADSNNSRIQKYNMNMQNPSITTVAGWGQLNNPYAVQLDPSGINMFIADTLNHRILVWLNGTLQGRIIAGNGIVGNNDTQLNSPAQIRFDSNYNLYVVDTNNSRIQRFDLISNGC